MYKLPADLLAKLGNLLTQRLILFFHLFDDLLVLANVELGRFIPSRSTLRVDRLFGCIKKIRGLMGFIEFCRNLTESATHTQTDRQTHTHENYVLLSLVLLLLLRCLLLTSEYVQHFQRI